MKQKSLSPLLIKIIKACLLLLLILGLFFGIQYITYERGPLPEAVKSLESDDLVKVIHEPWLTFNPPQTNQKTGFIFYPGGRINPQGYASLMRMIAEEGYLVIVPKMPINMAVFNANIADEIIDFYPSIDHWVIGGHSVGGTKAAQYTGTHREIINGLVIWASYPANHADLSGFIHPVVSIYGSHDPGVNDESIEERAHLLPDDTRYVRIEGGDHHQFGSYEIKPENDYATISRESQHRQIIQATLEVLGLIAQ